MFLLDTNRKKDFNISFTITEKVFTQVDVLKQFGRNAGLIWDAIHTHGALTESQLLDITGLRPYELHIAIGWLAREDKILFDGKKYMLASTNLTWDIGRAAGKVWIALATRDNVDIPSLSHLTNLDKQKIYNALGWLAREDKIQVKQRFPSKPNWL